MKKLLLTYPNQRWFKTDIATNHKLSPITLCLLAAVVKDMVQVQIIDAQFYDLSQEDFQDKIRQYQPDYVGISVLTSEYGATLDIAAKLVKAVNPDIVVIAGGVHVTTTGAAILDNPNIDYGCHGEGEWLLKELLLYLEERGERPATGLIYRENQEIIVQERRLVADMTQLPWPDYSLVNFDDYVNTDSRYGPNRLPELPGMHVFAARGCPFDCSFCQVDHIAGKKIRCRDPMDIADELEFLQKKHNLRSIVFDDDNFFSHKRTAKTLMREMIQRNLNLKWMAQGFALFSMDDEMLDLMVKSGCVGINVAVESGNKRVLKEIIHKPIKDLKKIPERIQQVKDHGVFVIANFVIGFPGESWQEIRETILFAETCHADYVKLFFAVPLKGTKLFDMAIEMDALIDPDNLRVDWRNSQLKSPEWTAKDLSILRVYEWDRINFSPERIQKTAEIWGMPVEEMNKVRKATRDSLKFV
ncbi:B12-binding domain-containing radical SAM protein [Magnetococcales bacterium HHB-1]